MRIRRGTATYLALTLLGSTGCAAAPAAPSLSVDDLGLSAVAVYGRHAAVRGKVDVRLANRGTAAVELVSVQLRTPLYERVPATDRSSTLPPDGKERIVPVDFGDVRCTATDTGGADVLLTVRTPDGAVDVAVPLIDGEPGLVRAHRLACASAAVAGNATLELGPASTREALRLRTTLRAERQGDAAVAVTRLLDNILFDVTLRAERPVLLLPVGERAAETQVLVTATRCDPHALTESKTSFTFPAFAQVDGGDEVATAVTATGAVREALQTLLDDTCGAP